MLAIDTLRADRLSTYGYRSNRPTSPSLDRLARDAIVFDNVIAQSNWTPESFASLFTSTYSGQHGVTERLTKLQRNDLAQALRTGGYLTQGIAYKLLLYDMGFERGFDAYFNVPRFHLSEGYDVHAGVNWARAAPWLRQHAERQVFLFFHLNDPHQPFNHRGESLTRFTDVPAMQRRGLHMPILIRNHSVTHGADSTKCKDCVRKNRFEPWFKELGSSLYNGSVAYVDRHVGLFVETLEELGLYDEAVIVVLSDHGEGLADHEDYIGHGFQHMYDEQIRVPLLLKPPARANMERPRRIAAQVRLVDVLPTLLELAGLPVPSSAEGSSLVPAMRGEPLTPRPALSENIDARTLAVRANGYKYVLRYGNHPPRERLYHLPSDAGEQTDLSGATEHGQALGEVRDLSIEHLARTHAGSFLVVACNGRQRTGSLTVALSDPAAQVVPLAGRVQRSKAEGTWSVHPTPHGRLCAAIRIAAAGDPSAHLRAGTARRSLPPLRQWPPYVEAQPLGLGAGFAVRALRNAARVHERREGLRGEELEALRALGYVEE
jgi:arylsulfatase A-like enzyme